MDVVVRTEQPTNEQRFENAKDFRWKSDDALHKNNARKKMIQAGPNPSLNVAAAEERKSILRRIRNAKLSDDTRTSVERMNSGEGNER